ncbi:MAG: carbamoyltransferase N-terminal domain-containing protein [Bacteroidota bacterium]
MNKILGISAYYHDSAAAILLDGELMAAAQEERFSREKHDAQFPKQAIAYCLEEVGLRLEDLDAIVFYDKPFLKFERLLETYYAFAPSGIRSFIQAIPVWLREKLFLKQMLRRELRALAEDSKLKLPQLLFPEHHLSHAASAFYASPFAEAAILTIDGVGEWATATICHGKGKHIKLLKELRFPHSVGLLYSSFTYFLGFKVNNGEYKLMGLAPFGDPNSPQTLAFRKKIETELVEIKEDGSLWLNPHYFRYATSLRMIHHRPWEKLFGFAKRQANSEIRQAHCDLALAIQQVTEEIVLRMAHEAKRLTGLHHLCLAGGVALNSVANGRLEREKIFYKLFIQPAAGDAGGALGAALAAHHLYFEAERSPKEHYMKGSLLGPQYGPEAVQGLMRRHEVGASFFHDFAELCNTVAKAIAEGKVVGWMQDRMEFGPRALGSRSILADPRNPEMQATLNLKIKFRESFRPFAPAVLAERRQDYFEGAESSPYMLRVHPVQESIRKSVPRSGKYQNPIEQLKHQRSSLPAITHVDYSARIQTVSEAEHPKFHALLKAFEAETGCPVLINTSFNVRGEPIVCTPEDAWRCFQQTEMDILVIDSYLFRKD